MVTLEEFAKVVPFREQLADASHEPVVLINVFHVPPEKVDIFLATWTDDSRVMKARPGFISTQLHRGIAGSGTFLNYAVWETLAAFRAAFKDPAFQAMMARYPDGVTASPYVFRKTAVAGVCVA